MNRTLLLNASFEPIRVVSWRRAFLLFFQGKVEVLEAYTAEVRTVTQSFKVPAVVRLRSWVPLKIHHRGIRFSRTNIYLRDNYQCQYCAKRFSEEKLTLDHIIPVVRGGKKNWENIVTACVRCNQKKGHKNLEEVGLSLLNVPRMPKWLPGFYGTVEAANAHELWEPYLEALK